MSKTNFDRYLDQKLEDPAFATRFEKAGEGWDVALQISDSRGHGELPRATVSERLRSTQK